jgi:hypothetical protein
MSDPLLEESADLTTQKGILGVTFEENGRREVELAGEPRFDLVQIPSLNLKRCLAIQKSQVTIDSFHGHDGFACSGLVSLAALSDVKANRRREKDPHRTCDGHEGLAPGPARLGGFIGRQPPGSQTSLESQ